MSHCPQCGKATPFEGAVACPYCGTLLGPPAPTNRPVALKPAARTMVGVSASDLRLPAAPAPAPVPVPAPEAGAARPKANQTIVGMPANLVPVPSRVAPPPQPSPELPDDEAATIVNPGPGPAHQGSAMAGAPRISSQVNRTIVGMTQPIGTKAVPHEDPRPGVVLPKPAGRTLVGVARPGIAPLSPGFAPVEEPDPPDSDPTVRNENNENPMGELGATMGPAAGAPWPLPLPGRRIERPARNDPRRRRHLAAGEDAAPKPKEAISKRALAVVFAAGGLALAAVLFALFWPSAPPLTARARADAEGREGVELHCSTCPDGTKVTIGAASATMTDGAALVSLPAALSLGENRMKVMVDRPGNARDETVGVTLNVAYRIRPDLTTLQAERPSIQIIAEAAKGTAISIDGKAMPIAGGRAVENIDVTDACTGTSSEPRSLTRQVPYTITPDSGPLERGSVNISVGIVPLQIDAPGPHVTTDGTSFILAGRTMKGAEVLAAGRPITVRADGTFAQQMNVSSVGATQIEVRAKVTGLAPRLTQIKVRRVDNLETAAREFSSEAPISYAPLTQNIAGQIGKAIALTGDVIEARTQGYETVILLDVARASGCPTAGTCTTRLVQGADNKAKKGDTIRVFGHVARAFSSPGRADIPEIEVDFSLKGQK